MSFDLIKENHWNNFSNNFNDRNEQICNKTKYTKVFSQTILRNGKIALNLR